MTEKISNRKFVLQLAHDVTKELRDSFGRWIGSSIKKQVKHLISQAPKKIKRARLPTKELVSKYKKSSEHIARGLSITKGGTSKRRIQALKKKNSGTRKEIAQRLKATRSYIRKHSNVLFQVEPKGHTKAVRSKIAKQVKKLRKEHYWKKVFQKAHVDVLKVGRKIRPKKSKDLKLSNRAFILALAHDVTKELRDNTGKWTRSISRIKAKPSKSASHIKSVTRIKPSSKRIKKLATAARIAVFKSASIATGTTDEQVEAAANSIAHVIHRLKGKKDLITKAIKKIPKLLSLSYTETLHPRDTKGRWEGTATHEGKTYDVAKLIRIAKRKKVYQQDISKFTHELGESLTDEDYRRIEAVTKHLHRPVIVTKTKFTKSGIVSVDGFHRIHKANQLGKKSLPAVKLTRKDLAKALILI